MRDRYYDPAIGRFMSQDPARDGRNWYAYCNNNPIDIIDDDGRLAGGLSEELITADMAEAVDSAGSSLAATILKGKALDLVLYIDARMAAMEAAFLGLFQTPRGQLVLRWISSITGETTSFRLDIAGGHINIDGFARNNLGGHAVEFQKWVQFLIDTFGQ